MKKLITSTRVEPRGTHDVVGVWSRGGKAGELVVEAGDGEAVARILRDLPGLARRLADALNAYANECDEGRPSGHHARGSQAGTCPRCADAKLVDELRAMLKVGG